MGIGAASLPVYRRRALPLALAADVIGSRNHHGLIGPQLGKAIVAPVRGKLRRELRVILLQGHITTAIFELTNYHIASFISGLFQRAELFDCIPSTRG